MRKRDLLFAGLLLMGVSAFAQPADNPQNPQVVFMQQFEDDWESWTSTVVETIDRVAYYNYQGNSSGTFDIYDHSFDWDIYGYRDTVIFVQNGVLTTDGDPRTIPNDSYTIVMDQSAERAEEFARFGEDGGGKYFQYVTDKPVVRSDDAPWGIQVQSWGGGEYSNGVTASYRRNLFVRGLYIDDRSSYRLTFYVKAQKLGSTDPVLYADVMRGYFSSEKPFCMANSNSSFEFSKTNFTGDWEKVTFMTYYTNDSIADGYMYKNGYWWAANGAWTWNVDGMELNYIKQPDTYFVRLSFASDSTWFGIDNLSLTKSTIAGVEYYQDKIRVDFGYQTNLNILAQNAYDINHIAAVEVPGEYFEVWGQSGNGSWEEIPIRSAEYHGDGYMYMFADSYILGGEEYTYRFDDYQKIQVTFHNPVDRPDLALYYTGSLYPNSDDAQWVSNGKAVLDFEGEEASLNPYVFENVYSLKELPPVMQKPQYEEGSFGMDQSTTQLSFQFSREIMLNNLLAYVGNEEWLTEWNDNKSSLVLTRPAKYTSPLAGDYEISIVNIQGIGTGLGEDVTLHYHFGAFDRYPNIAYWNTDWSNEIEEGGTWSRPLPSSLYLHSGTDAFQQGTGYYSTVNKCGLYKMNGDGQYNVGFYLSNRTSGKTGNLYSIETLPAGDYLISFRACGWGGNNRQLVVKLYPKPEGELIDGNENGFAILEAVADKVEIGRQETWNANVSAAGNWPEGSSELSYKFNIPTAGDYVFEFYTDGSSNYQGVLFSNYVIKPMGDLSSYYTIPLNEAIDDAQEIVYNSSLNSQFYGGDCLSDLEEVLYYYQYDFTSTAPSDWEGARYEVNYYAERQQSRMSSIDGLLSWLGSVGDALLINGESYELSEYISLESVYSDYTSQDFTALSGNDISSQEEILEEGLNAFNARIALSKEFNNQMNRGWDAYTSEEHPEYNEYEILGGVLSNYANYPYNSVSSDDIKDAIAAVKKATNDYSYKSEMISAQTRRIVELADLAQGLKVNNSTLYEMAYSAVEDNDVLADALKAAIKVALYSTISDGNDFEDMPLTPFIKNFNLYATPKIVERTQYQMPNNASALSVADPDGANIQLVQHQYSSGDLFDHKPIWIMILDQNYDDLIPGWNIQAPNTGSGNRMVTVDTDDYEHFLNEVPVFDGQITLDWNSKAVLSTELIGLPVGYYSIGVETPQLSNSASMSVETYYADGSYDSYSNVAYNSDDFGSLYVEDVYVDDGNAVGLNFSITSGSGFSVADNFFMYYTPDPYVNYSSLLADALDEYNAAMALLDETYVPVDPTDPLAEFKGYLDDAVSYAQSTLADASQDIYGGADYDNLESAIEEALAFEGEDGADYYNLAEALYSYSRKLNSRISGVDDFLRSLSKAESALEEYIEYSNEQAFAELSIMYDSASVLSITEQTSKELTSWTLMLNNAYNNLVKSVNGVTSGRLYMEEGLVGEGGKSLVIPVKLQIPTDITAFQFDVELPYGFMLTDAIIAADRANGHQLDYNLISDTAYYDVRQSYRFTCVSLNNNALVGNDGAIVYLTVKLNDYYKENYNYVVSLHFTGIELTASPTETYYPDNYYGTISLAAPVMYGDVNGDGNITITDAVGIVAFIIDSDVDGLDERAADANRDGEIDAADVVWVINKILGRNTATVPNGAPRRAAARMIGSTVSIDNSEIATQMSVPVRMNGVMNEITAVQFSLTLPEGVTLNGIKTDGQHMVSSNKVDGSYNVVCLSLKNSTFSGNGDAALTLELTSDRSFNGGEVMLNKILVVTPDGLKQSNESVSGLLGAGGETGIRSIGADSKANMYDLQGRAIDNANGIYIQDGKKSILMK